MKKLLLVALVSLFIFSSKVTANESCEAISRLAEAVMTARQNNMDMTRVVAVANRDPDIREIAMAIVKEAYAQPRFSTPSNQQQAIRDFKNEVYLTCLNVR